MSEANIASTTTILGRTNTALLFTHWKTVVYNDPQNRAALKINSLFITNRSSTIVGTDVRLVRNKENGDYAVYNDSYFYAYLMNEWYLPQKTTVIAISRDNPVWLQPGDFLQINVSQNYCASATCSYEYVSDEPFVPSTTITQPGPVMNLNAAPLYNTEGVQLTWSPPLTDGGAPISNYLVLCRQKVVEAASPTGESWTDWRLLERPVSNVPSLCISGIVVVQNDLVPYGDSFISRYRLDTVTMDAPATVNTMSLTASPNVIGFEFAVAAHNSVQLGPFTASNGLVRIDAIGTVGDKTGTLRIGIIEEISAAVSPNKVSLNWAGYTPKINADTGETITLTGYRIRWSHDSGMTWLPSPNGVDIGASNTTSADVNGLQNGLDYEFSLQAVCSRVKDSNPSETDVMFGPWSPNTRVLRPPGNADEPQALQRMETMFVRWVHS
jgi:hypothetical protein